MREYQDGFVPERWAQDLLHRYGGSALRVARDWAEIKHSQGGPESATRWQSIAAAIERHQTSAALS